MSAYLCECCRERPAAGALRFCYPCLDSGAADKWLDAGEPTSPGGVDQRPDQPTPPATTS